ncbi:MAG: hypothetical protein RL711_310 [Bacteroidota bacterium]|jgi:hypothetical protein
MWCDHCKSDKCPCLEQEVYDNEDDKADYLIQEYEDKLNENLYRQCFC